MDAREKSALAWTFFCYVRFSEVSSRANSTHHRRNGESPNGILLASAPAATSSRVIDGWRPSASLGPRLNPPLRVWCGRPRQPGATRGSFRGRTSCPEGQEELRAKRGATFPAGGGKSLLASQPWLVERALTDAFPGARVQVIPDREIDALSITAPEGTDSDQTAQAVELATRSVERVYRLL